VDATTLADFLGKGIVDTNDLRFILTNNYAYPSNVDATTLADFLGKGIVDTNNLRFILTNNYAYPSNVDATTLADFLRKSIVDTNDLRFILTNNYAHPTIVDRTTLADFLGSTNGHSVTKNDVILFGEYHVATNAAAGIASPANAADWSVLSVLLSAQSWPVTNAATGVPLSIFVSTNCAGQASHRLVINNHLITLQFSTNLLDWVDSAAVQIPPFEVTDTNNSTQGFYRLLYPNGN